MKHSLFVLALLLSFGCGSNTDFSQLSTSASGNSNTNSNSNNNNSGSGGSTINLTLSGSSNAMQVPFPADTVVTGTLSPDAATATGLLSQLTQALTSAPVGTRSINIGISDVNTLAVGDTFTVKANADPTPRATVNYNEQTTAGTFAFAGTTGGGGTVKITSLTPGSGVSGTIGLELTNVNLAPVSQGGNSATGTLIINGTATLSF